MPELPEVETIRRGLNRKLIGKTISQIEVRVPKLFQGNSQFAIGQKVLSIDRKAKNLLINLSGGKTLIFHLKMTGQLIYVENQGSSVKDHRFIGGHPTKDMRGEMPNKYTRVVFTLIDHSLTRPPLSFLRRSSTLRLRPEGQESKIFMDPPIELEDDMNETKKKSQPESYLYFNDQRKFGWVKLVGTKDLSLGELGPEPLEKEFTWQILKTQLLKHKSLPVKVALLDQKTVSGIGNIYACEACFNAKLDPRKKVSDLSDADIKKLHKGIIDALENGIKYGGSSRTHFVNEEGKKGLFLDHAFVYNRDGQMCKVCGSKIKKVKLGGRGTFFCPKCQKL